MLRSSVCVYLNSFAEMSGLDTCGISLFPFIFILPVDFTVTPHDLEVIRSYSLQIGRSSSHFFLLIAMVKRAR